MSSKYVMCEPPDLHMTTLHKDRFKSVPLCSACKTLYTIKATIWCYGPLPWRRQMSNNLFTNGILNDATQWAICRLHRRLLLLLNQTTTMPFMLSKWEDRIFFHILCCLLLLSLLVLRCTFLLLPSQSFFPHEKSKIFQGQNFVCIT